MTTPPTPERPLSLREQRRLELRTRLSDTATRMFLEHGFDAVKVADVARACGVTEKTVFNHFPSKESLLVDRWGDLVRLVCAHLADPSIGLLDAAVRTLVEELDLLTEHGRAPEEHMAAVARFGSLIESTPALLADRRRSRQELTDEVVPVVAARLGTGPDDPRAQIVGEAISGLFAVFYVSLGRNSRKAAADCRRLVAADVRAAARELASGIGR